jgi:hypothetical protein
VAFASKTRRLSTARASGELCPSDTLPTRPIKRRCGVDRGELPIERQHHEVAHCGRRKDKRAR